VKRKLLATFVMLTTVGSAALLGLMHSEPQQATGVAPLQLGVAEFLRRPLLDERVFLNGYLVKGSLCRISEPCEVRFRVTDRAVASGTPPGHTLAVSFPSCVVPRPLRSTAEGDVQVIVGGQVCATCHDFQASDVLARATHDVPAPTAPFGDLPDSLDGLPLCSAL
jgi:cytochrome c-type biogenesis protein CcmE